MSPATDALARLAAAVGTAAAPEDAYRALLALVRGTMPCSSLFVTAYDASARTRRCIYAWSEGEEVEPAALPPLPLNQGPPSRAILASTPLLTHDYQAATQGQYRIDVGRHVDPRLPRASVCAPIAASGEVVGVVEVQSTHPGAYAPHDASLLHVAASLLAPTLLPAQRARLREQAGLLARATEEHALARGLVRGLLKRLGEKGGIRPDVLRSVGREMGAGLQARDLPDVAATYAAMGLGDLRHVETRGERSVFHGRDLLERDLLSPQPTCHFALGFLEGALGRDRPSLGTEMRCQSQGRERCEFVVVVRDA